MVGFFFFCFVFYLIFFIHDSLRRQCPLSHNPSPLCSKSAKSLSSSQITWQGKKHYITACDVISISDIAEVPRGAGYDWQFNDCVSPCDRGGRRQLRKAHNSFGVLSSDSMRFMSCCVEWQALEHLSVLLLWIQTTEKEHVCHVVSNIIRGDSTRQNNQTDITF